MIPWEKQQQADIDKVKEHHIIPDRPFNRRNEQYVGIFRKI